MLPIRLSHLLPGSRLLPLLALPLLATAACSRAPAQDSSVDAPVSASAAAPDTDDAGLLARGEYLTRIAGCNDCHTPGYAESAGAVPTTQWLVGSPLGWNGPWGTTYPINVRLKLQDMDEAAWMQYSANLHTRPPMPDLAIRTMSESDRRALYHFIRSLGPGGQPAPAYLPPGQAPQAPYVQWVLPPGPPPAPAAG